MNHRQARGQADKNRSPEARGVAVFAAIEAEERTRHNGAEEAHRDFGPVKFDRHGVSAFQEATDSTNSGLGSENAADFSD